MNALGHDLRGELTTRECVDALRTGRVARVGVVDRGAPVVLPFSYLVSGTADTAIPGTEAVGLRVFVHVTSGGAVSRAEGPACLELDAVHEQDGVAWSVVVTGQLRSARPGELPPGHRGAIEDWRVIEVDRISGRRFTAIEGDRELGFSVEWQVGG